ncbi:MAG: hypothetical protein JOZ66_11065 [Hyphomicrobiales bacterium]|nr:hypothetical protein [Hyphomicrobiales bacterium]
MRQAPVVLRSSRALVAALISFGTIGSTDLNAKLLPRTPANDVCAILSCYGKASRIRLAASNKPGAASSAQTPSGGGWRLMRTLNPHGGPDAVSIVHTADVSRSDLDLAGLMLRCAPGGVEALVIVLDPRPPSSKPLVELRIAGVAKKFETRIVPPFTALLLPPEAAALLTNIGLASEEVAIEIETQPSAVKGTVPLVGLGGALGELRASCPPQ